MSNHKQFLQDIKLTTNNQNFFNKTHTFFQPFAGFTLVGKNKKSSISQMLNAINTFLKHYEPEKIILILKLKTTKCCIQSI